MITVPKSIAIPGLNDRGYNANIEYILFDLEEHKKHLIWDSADIETTFVETGTFFGHGVMSALALGARDIHSIELSKPHFLTAKLKITLLAITNSDILVETTAREDYFSVSFMNQMRISLYRGDSGSTLPRVLENITDKATFWLDAHWGPDLNSDLTEDSPAEELFPIFKELEAIKAHNIKEHTIMIDDIHQFEQIYPGKLPTLKRRIKSINKKYKFKKSSKSSNEGAGNILISKVPDAS